MARGKERLLLPEFALLLLWNAFDDGFNVEGCAAAIPRFVIVIEMYYSRLFLMWG